MLFTKMHGLGNDFIVIEDNGMDDNDYSTLASKLCHRHFGIGADGILVVKKSEIADSKMLIFNSDGSQAEMCGNGLRCYAKYLYDNNVVRKNPMTIDTLDGVKKVLIEEKNNEANKVQINMGKPILEPSVIPANFTENIINTKITADGEEFQITSMLMGVPHTIVFVEDFDNTDFEGIGKRIENSSYFPKKTNVNFVKVMNGKEFKIRTWERGAGLTLACGTGACAALVACALNNKTGKEALAHLAGGDLHIIWDDSNDVYMTGPAITVFKGESFI
ncbi:diaminopimelate epimerase [Oxobacter pfennigii]|uniref:Diaminopimelate epimerase n=1 Tax=Oxobacter pfennigii TaxID=36849 RepID=A0A0P8W5M7_9CLOT|nr:diaminopimelate epimerase [Oxobacter pfennigii]KPU43988.1 diaminopimelate epimerase [Oxobacter pfennigii]